MGYHSYHSVLKLIPRNILLFIVISLLITGKAYADQGDTFSAQGTFTDVVTGIKMKLSVSAKEDLGEDYGHTKYFLSGHYAPARWAIRSCSTHGAPGTYVNGLAPLKQILCGRNGRMLVSINKCKVKIQTHAYVHSDVPFVTYSGQTTTEITLKKNKGKRHVHMSIYTPKSKIKLHGKFVGNMEISNCNSENKRGRRD